VTLGSAYVRFRKMLKCFAPYEWELPSSIIAIELGLKAEQIIRFDTNTSPNIPSKWLQSLSSKLPNININDYPDTSYFKFRENISKYLNITPSNITVTNGADEGLDILAKAFIDPGYDVAISTPTYMYYEKIASIAGGNVIHVNRQEDFSNDITALMDVAQRDKTCLIFICNPNNPTGNWTTREDLVNLLEVSDATIVIDEAYSEFNGKTMVDMTDHYDNLVVLRTFSKAFCLAGARVGYIVSSKSTINTINKVRPPNSLSTISLALAEIALNDLQVMRSNVKLIIKERERCRKYINDLKGVYAYPSETNFLLISFNELDPNQVHAELFQHGLIVRNVSEIPRLERCLRFNIRLPIQNNILLNEITKIINKTN
jgi:histidinol-phosphate aminotransferase